MANFLKIFRNNDEYNAYIQEHPEDAPKYGYCIRDVILRYKTNIIVTSVTLNKSTMDLASGSSEQLVATVLPENADDKRVIWTSSDNNIAIVNEQGLVTAVKGGTCIIKATSVDGGYTASCAVTIAKANGRVTTVPTAIEGLSYDDMAHALVTAGEGTGTMLYSLDEVTWSYEIPEAINAGNYVVYFKTSENYDYYESEIGSVSVSIAKATPTVTAPTVVSLVYNGSKQQLVNAGHTNLGTLQYSIDNTEYSVNVPSGINASSYTVYYKVVGDSNVSDVPPQSVSATISKVTPTVSAPVAYELTYNTSAQVLASEGTTDYGVMQYSLNIEGTYTTSVPSQVNAGTYKLWYKVIGNSNVNDVEPASVDCSIASKYVESPDITLSQSSYVYNGSACQPTVTVKDGDVTISVTEYTVSYINNINVGTATAIINDKEDGNYYVGGRKDFEIVGSAPSYIAPTVKSGLVYTGYEIELLNPGSVDGGTMLYSTDGVNWNSNVPVSVNASQTIITYWRIEGDDNHDDVGPVELICSIEKANGSVTIAPSANSLTYNETAQSLVSDGFGTGTILYKLDEGEWETNVPTAMNAGNYTVYYKAEESENYLESNSGSVSASIAKITPVVSAPTAMQGLVYTTAPQALIYAGSTNYGVIQYSLDNTNYSTSIPSGTSVGSYTVYYKVVGNSNVNDVAAQSLSVTISNAQGIVTTAPTAIAELVYSNTNYALVIAGSGTGTMMYKLDSTEWSTSIPSGNNASVYTVYYKAAASDNYDESPVGSLQVEIAKVTPTVTAPTPKSGLIYNESEQVLANAGSTNYGTLQYSVDDTTYDVSIPTGINAGDYEVYYKVVGNSNVNDVEATYIEAYIAKASASYTAPSPVIGIAYDGQPHDLLLPGFTDDGAMVYSSDGNNWSVTIPTGINSGEYTSYWKIYGDFNHNDTEPQTVTTSIGKPAGSVTFMPVPKQGVIYNGFPQEIVTAGSGTGTMMYKLDSTEWSSSLPTVINAGSYTVYYKAAESENYAESPSGSVVTEVLKRNPSINVPKQITGLIYNGANQALVTAGATDAGTFKYSSDNSIWTDSVPSGMNAGDYSVWYRVIGDGLNINDVYPTLVCTGPEWAEICTITISKVTPTVVAPTPKVLTFNGSAQELVNAGSTNFGTLQYRVGSDSWSTSIPTRTKGGSYTVEYRVVGDSNINDVAAQSVSCSINEKPVTATVTLSQTAYTYNGSACQPTPTVKDGGTVIDPSEYSVTYSNNVNAGTGTVTISDNTGGDYNVIGSATFTINKANPTYTAPTATSPTYNGSAQNLLNAGSTSDGTIQYSSNNTNWSTTIPSKADAGTYTSYWRIIGDSNHNDVASASISTTIAKASQSAPTATGATTTYSTTATATASGGGGQGSLEWESAQSQTSVGSHSTRARWSGNSNYNASPWSNSVTVQMNKANQSAPTATGATVNYGSTATATASGGGGQGSLEWSNGNTRTAVGSQTTSARWSGNGNYNASPWSNSVTLIVNEHEYVEIGGKKWATMNIGANSVTDTGLYFQWGDTQGYTAAQCGGGAGQKYFGWADYKYGNGTSSPSATDMTKYNSTDGKTVLEASDDAARAAWGDQWRTPTIGEMQSLFDNTTSAWTADYQGSGVAGMVLTDKTDSSKTLFFPACGYCRNGIVYDVGSNGYYYTSSLDSSRVRNAYQLSFEYNSVYLQYPDFRYFGFSVRPVVD